MLNTHGCWFLLLVTTHMVNGFQTQQCSKSPSTLRRARPPPTANFDLEAIEQFEEQLLKEVDDDEDEEDAIIFIRKDRTSDNIIAVEVNEENHNKRIDTAIPKLVPDLSRSSTVSLLSNGHVRIVYSNGKNEVVYKKNFKVEKGMALDIELPEDEKPTEVLAQNLPLDILYEDEHLIVLNKGNNMVVHPAVGHWDGTVVNALAYYLANDSPYGSGEFVGEDGMVRSENADGISIEGTDGEAISFRPGIVHRLDKGTTGVLIVAKTRAALSTLSSAFKERKVKKKYLAITVGNPGKGVTIDKPIGRHPVYRQRMRVVPDPHKRNSAGFAPKDRMNDGVLPPGARNARSHVDTISFDGKLSLVQVRIETGRKHQIRVHLQDRRTPVYGDDVYGLEVWNKRLSKVHQITRPLLHAYTLEINHPITGELLNFRAPIPVDMQKIIKTIWPQGAEEQPEFFKES